MQTVTVAQLVAQLQALPQDAEVRVWLPGSTIALSSAFAYKGAVRIEGNVDPGSALDSEAPPRAGDEAPSSEHDTYLERFPPDQRATADRAYQDGFVDGATSEHDSKALEESP